MNFLYLFNVIIGSSLARVAWDHDKASMIILGVAGVILNLFGYIFGEVLDNKRPRR